MKSLNEEAYKKFADTYEAQPEHTCIESAISNVGLVEASKNKRVIQAHSFIFSQEIDHKNITDQKQSGRCWLFAALNMARPAIMRELHLEAFELSQSYLYFFDNMEKTNVFLDKIIQTKHLDINSREVVRALTFKTEDGGYFEYFKALIEKYGIVPKTVMGESFHTENSQDMFARVEEIIKKYAMDIRRSEDDGQIETLKEECLCKVYGIFVKCIGKPVEQFDFEYKDKDNKYHIERNMTPRTFYKKYVAHTYENKIRLIHDPRARHPYGRVFVNPDIKNIVEMDGLKGLNVPTEVMKTAMIRSLQDGQSAWFACDVGKMSDRKTGIMDTRLFTYEETVAPVGTFTKADRLDSRQSVATHAMNITGVNVKDGKPVYWKVENSWGDKNGHKGIFSMTDAWFDAYVYELIIDKKYVDSRYLQGFEQDPVPYSPYDAFCTILNYIK